MLESFPLPVATAAPSNPSRMEAAPAGKAGGPASMEIFTSFRSLVDALAAESDGGAHAASRKSSGHGAAADDSTTAVDAKADEDAGSVVVPLDIAALLMSHVATPQGPGGSTPQPGAAAEEQGHHVWSAGDLAALLLGEQGGAGAGIAKDGAANPAGDTVELSSHDAAFASGLPVDPSGPAAGLAAEAALAQAVAQRLGLAAGPRPLTTELAGRVGGSSQNLVDDLFRQVTLTSDKTPSAGSNAASRLMGSFVHSATPASATATMAGEVGAAGAPLELPSNETVDRIIQAIRLQWTKGGGEAQIRLEPRQFGDLTVSVSVNQGQVVARLQADTPVVREWLQANHQVLRQGLADQHLTLSRLEVSEPSSTPRQGAPRDGQSPADDGRPGRRPIRRPRTPDTGETFDIVA